MVKTAPSTVSVKTVPAVIRSPGAAAVHQESVETCVRMVSQKKEEEEMYPFILLMKTLVLLCFFFQTRERVCMFVCNKPFHQYVLSVSTLLWPSVVELLLSCPRLGHVRLSRNAEPPGTYPQ